MDDSPVLKLAPELRNIKDIYELVLRESERFIITFRPGKGGGLRQKKAFAKEHPLALLFTCKIINIEASQLFYAINSFAMCRDDALGGVSLCKKFKAQIGPRNAASLKPLSIELPPVELCRSLIPKHRDGGQAWWLANVVFAAQHEADGVTIDVTCTSRGRQPMRTITIDADQAEDSLRYAIAEIKRGRDAHRAMEGGNALLRQRDVADFQEVQTFVEEVLVNYLRRGTWRKWSC